MIRSIILGLAVGGVLFALASSPLAVGSDDREERNVAAPASPPRMNW